MQVPKNTAKISNTDDSECFQRELDEKVYPWAPKINMCLNGDKFEHHRIGNNLNIEKHSYVDPNGEVINEKEYIKIWGYTYPVTSLGRDKSLR